MVRDGRYITFKGVRDENALDWFLATSDDIDPESGVKFLEKVGASYKIIKETKTQSSKSMFYLICVFFLLLLMVTLICVLLKLRKIVKDTRNKKDQENENLLEIVKTNAEEACGNGEVVI